MFPRDALVARGIIEDNAAYLSENVRLQACCFTEATFGARWLHRLIRTCVGFEFASHHCSMGRENMQRIYPTALRRESDLSYQ